MRYITYYPTTFETTPKVGPGAMLRELFAATPLSLFIAAARDGAGAKHNAVNRNGHNGDLKTA